MNQIVEQLEAVGTLTSKDRLTISRKPMLVKSWLIRYGAREALRRLQSPLVRSKNTVGRRVNSVKAQLAALGVPEECAKFVDSPCQLKQLRLKWKNDEALKEFLTGLLHA